MSLRDDNPMAAFEGMYDEIPSTRAEPTPRPSDDVKPSENWRPVVGFEGWYEVSDLGRVRRIAPVRSRGNRQTAGGIMQDYSGGRGYRYVNLFREGKRTGVAVHILVAAAFIGPRPIGLEVNHKDGEKTNNAAANLEYLTRRENQDHERLLPDERLYSAEDLRTLAAYHSEPRARVTQATVRRLIATAAHYMREAEKNG